MLRSFFKGSFLAVLVVAALSLTALSLTAVGNSAAAQGLTVRIHKGSQTMSVYVGGALWHRWPVSTGRRGYGTPSGSFRATRLERMWHSRKYEMAPMPYSVFFKGGYAIHGTYEVKRLGRPASHGCVRLAPSHAKQLFSLVSQYGMGSTRIDIR